MCIDGKIEKIDLFREALANGINIVTGAGFSVLPDNSGKRLPNAKQLCAELEVRFNEKNEGWDLEILSDIIESRYPDEFQNYLRNIFSVSDYNPLYDAINKVNINSLATTNIDNLIHLICAKSSRYSLTSYTYYGASKRTPENLRYIPLHGDVTDLRSKLHFGKFDLSFVDEQNKALFEILFSHLTEAPTLFWGYGFHDSGVAKVISHILSVKKENIWVQCLPGAKEIALFKRKDCFIIESDTADLLNWISVQNIADPIKISDKPISDSILSRYVLPSPAETVAISQNDFFKNGNTGWYNVFYNTAYETSYVNDVLELSKKEKIIILTGIPFAGKTTLLMQIATKAMAEIKLYISEITQENAQMIIKHLNGKKCIIFFDNCLSDIAAFRLLASCHNIQIVGVDDEYVFESCKHLLTDITHAGFDVSEISEPDARKLYNKIPPSIRNRNFQFRIISSDKTSIFEIINYNVTGIISKGTSVSRILSRILKISREAFDTVALTAFLTLNDSLLSIDIILSYFSTNYYHAKEIINTANSFLKEIEVNIIADTLDQDYFSLRSHLFANACHNILTYKFKTLYADILKKFFFEVSPLKIFRYDKFKRRAYDADFLYHIFKNNGSDIYKRVFSFSQNEYTLQQWALYLLKCKGYEKDAFKLIDQARRMAPYNFSIRNSYAIMLFESNKKTISVDAHMALLGAMKILEDCYNNDKRKIYHAQKFAEYAEFLYLQYDDSDYTEKAYQWLTEIVNSENFASYKTKKLLRRLMRIK